MVNPRYHRSSGHCPGNRSSNFPAFRGGPPHIDIGERRGRFPLLIGTPRKDVLGIGECVVGYRVGGREVVDLYPKGVLCHPVSFYQVIFCIPEHNACTTAARDAVTGNGIAV